jgi:hypothetical protein
VSAVTIINKITKLQLGGFTKHLHKIKALRELEKSKRIRVAMRIYSSVNTGTSLSNWKNMRKKYYEIGT